MKKKLFKKMVAFAVAAVLILGGNSISALAADDGTEADAPKGDTGTTKASSGAASALKDTTDAGFYVIGDDDNTEADVKTDTETDIGIWATVVEHGDLVYKVDISWGAMKFEFNNHAGKWNTESHQYEENGSGVSQEWTVEGFINATNNKITVVNHSNGAVNAEFTYAHEGTTDTVFNTAENKDGNSAVRGYFFWTNANAQAAALNLTNSTSNTIANEIEDSFMLGHQDSSNATNYGGATDGTTVSGNPVTAVAANADGSCTRDVYFTFAGKPDETKMTGAITTGFTKVGVITVTIAPTV